MDRELNKEINIQSPTPKRKKQDESEKEKERSDFKFKLEEEINHNIKSRSIKCSNIRTSQTVKKNTSFIKKSMGESHTRRNCRSDLDQSENNPEMSGIKNKLYMKCKTLNPEIFEGFEKNKIELRIRMMTKLEEHVLWLWDYLEDKAERMYLKIKGLETERGKPKRGALYLVCCLGSLYRVYLPNLNI